MNTDDEASVSSIETEFGVGPDFGNDYINAIHAGIVAAAQKWNVTLPEGQTFKDFDSQKGQSKRFANMATAETTKINYEEQLKQLWRFCAMKGDYESMLIMITPTPDDVPSMRVETIEEYLRFKQQAKNQILKTYDKSGDVKDIQGTTIKTEGHWHAPRQAGMYGSAISAIHCQNGKGGEYKDSCDGCRNKTCTIISHSASPRVERTGNPTAHFIFKNSMKQSKKDGVNHRERGSSQLLPSDLRALRESLLSSNLLVDLQMWTIIILSVCLFLRHDEFNDIKIDQFDPDLFCIKENRVAWLAVQIKGKRDKQWYTFRVNANDEHPDLCPVRALVVYFASLAIVKSGRICKMSVTK